MSGALVPGKYKWAERDGGKIYDLIKYLSYEILIVWLSELTVCGIYIYIYIYI